MKNNLMESMRRKYYGLIPTELFDEVEQVSLKELGTEFHNYFNEEAASDLMEISVMLLDTLVEISSTNGSYSISDNVDYIVEHEEEIINKTNKVFNKLCEEFNEDQNAASLDYCGLMNDITSFLNVDKNEKIVKSEKILYNLLNELLNTCDRLYKNHHNMLVNAIVAMNK